MLPVVTRLDVRRVRVGDSMSPRDLYCERRRSDAWKDGDCVGDDPPASDEARGEE